MRSIDRRDATWLLVLFAGGVILRAGLVASSGFDGLYGQDSYAYFDFASELRSALPAGRSPGPFFWPLGYPALLAMSFTLFGTAARAVQAVNVLLGAGLAPLVYLLARQMRVRRAGALAAGTMMAVSGQALQSSLVIMADIPALTWATVSAVTLWRYLQGGRGRWLLAAAITLAVAGITRWLYLALALPWAAALLLTWRGGIRRRDVLLAVASTVPIFIPQLIYSRSNPFPTFNHAWVQGWSPANAARREFANIDGHFNYADINAIFYAQPFYDAYYLAPVFTVFIVVGLWALIRACRRAALAMLVGWALVPFVFLAGIPYQNIRFPLIVLPAAALLAGAGLDAAFTWARHIRAGSVRWRHASAAGFAAILLAGAGHTFIISRDTIDTFIANQQRDKAVVAWAREQIPNGAQVYTFGITLTMQHYTSADVYEVYYETPQTLADRWQAGRDDYLLINVWNIENQWAGREPQIAYHWLRDRRGLDEIGRFGNYTLFRVRG